MKQLLDALSTCSTFSYLKAWPRVFLKPGMPFPTFKYPSPEIKCLLLKKPFPELPAVLFVKFQASFMYHLHDDKTYFMRF